MSDISARLKMLERLQEENEQLRAKLVEYEQRKCETCKHSVPCYRHIMISDERVVLFTNQTGCPAWSPKEPQP